MKILLAVCLSVVSLNLTYSQKNEIKTLNKIKSDLIEKKNKISDSIKKIDIRLNFLENKKDEINAENRNYTKTFTRSKAKVKNKPEIFGDVIGFIPKGTEIKVFDYFDTYWLIEKDSIKGYTSEMYLKNNLEMNKIKEKHDKNEILEKYGESIANKIFNHRIWIGMTKDMAKLSIGTPIDINRSTGSWGISEQWIYKNKYLYFENGELTSWQD